MFCGLQETCEAQIKTQLSFINPLLEQKENFRLNERDRMNCESSVSL